MNTENSINYFKMFITCVILNIIFIPFYNSAEKYIIIFDIVKTLTILVYLGCYLKKRRNSLKKFVNIKNIDFIYILRQSIFLFLISGLGIKLYYYLASFMFPNHLIIVGRSTYINSLISSRGVIAVIFSTTILAPIEEEIIFRKLFLGIFSKSNIKFGIFFSSFLFALAHRDNYLDIFISGVLFSIVYLKSQSLFVSLVCHSLVNATVLLFYFLSPEARIVTLLKAQSYLLAVISTNFIILLAIYIIYKDDFKINLGDKVGKAVKT